MPLSTKIALGCIVFVSLFLNLYRQGTAPPCFNADEAAFSYNAWSILKTGKDEHGDSFPLRLASYGDYKLPLLTYLTVPFVGVFGLNEQAARLPNTFIAILFPFVIFFLAKELFGKDKIALAAAFLVSASLGMHIVGRHLHEAYLAAFLVSGVWLFYLRSLRQTNVYNAAMTFTFIFLSLFTYHSSRIFAIGFLLHAIYAFGFQKKEYGKQFLIGLFTVVALFAITDIVISPARVKNLLFFNNPGYVMKIQQMRDEGSPRFMYNKLVPGVKDIFVENLKYFSPQFLLVTGDENYRFGHPGMAIITVIEYLLFFVGLYYLFAKKEKYRWLLLFILFITPAAASLSWAGLSLTRSLFIIIPISLIAAYGFYAVTDPYKKKPRLWQFIFFGILCLEMVNLVYNWDYFLRHYPKRTITAYSWQCGYKEMAQYVKENYDKYDTFYITRQHGQPYMFLLFFMQYDPEKFHGKAKLTPPDEYGFTQVDSFDKFNFNFKAPKPGENAVYIGRPADDFKSQPQNFPGMIDSKKIKYGSEEIFWIYENPKHNPLPKEESID